MGYPVEIDIATPAMDSAADERDVMDIILARMEAGEGDRQGREGE